MSTSLLNFCSLFAVPTFIFFIVLYVYQFGDFQISFFFFRKKLFSSLDSKTAVMGKSWKTESRSIATVMQDWENERFVIPVYQRADWAWPQSHKSKLISSILSGMIMPQIVINEITNITEENKYHIVDGRHRLETIYLFTKGEFSWKDGNKSLYFKDLNKKQKSVFKDYSLSLLIMDDWTEDRAREYFNLVNRGVPLKACDKLNALESPTLRELRRNGLLLDQLGEVLFSMGVVSKTSFAKTFQIAVNIALIVINSGFDSIGKSSSVYEHFENEKKPSKSLFDRILRTIRTLCIVFENTPNSMKNVSELYTIAHHISTFCSVNTEKALDSDYAHFYKTNFTDAREKLKDNTDSDITEYYNTLGSSPNSKIKCEKRFSILKRQYNRHKEKSQEKKRKSAFTDMSNTTYPHSIAPRFRIAFPPTNVSFSSNT